MRRTFVRCVALSVLITNGWAAPQISAEPPRARSKEPAAKSAGDESVEKRTERWRQQTREEPEISRRNEVVWLIGEYCDPPAPVAPDTRRTGADPPVADASRPATTAAPEDREWQGLERQWQEAREKPEIPKPKDVLSIVAETYCHPMAAFAPDIKPFTIPEKYYGDLLDFFRRAELDKEADPFAPELGTMRISVVGRGDVRICWFWERQGARLHYSYRGIRYRSTGQRFAYDETLTVDGFVGWINEVAIAHVNGGPEPRRPPAAKRPTEENTKKATTTKSGR